MLSVQNVQVVPVVDDTPENIDVLRKILQPEFRVKAALKGNKAIKIAQAMPQPDLILLDIVMPDIDGYEVCRLPMYGTIHVPYIGMKTKVISKRVVCRVIKSRVTEPNTANR
ncbi:response regulator [Parendozoicomonas sp. Alg238-R29]|uniref:response regulator n=1 Tax=Parendozoicomonas sp. Alg238-R29 TaxID=2993446 RepID=UPI00248DB39B|nr:response regulator [Parendozoicomonas sp. Alg238-R29]